MPKNSRSTFGVQALSLTLFALPFAPATQAQSFATPIPTSIQVPGSESLTISGGDLDQNGDVDLVISSATEGLLIGYQSSGNYLPSQVTTETAIYGHALGDVDLDGDIDIAVVHAGGFGWPGSCCGGKVVVYWNSGGGTFTPTTISTNVSGGREIIIADMTGDGLPDIAWSGRGGNGIRGIRGLGASQSFGAEFVIGSVGEDHGLAAFDPDLDGDVDLVACSYWTAATRLFENTGGSNFSGGNLPGSNSGPTLKVLVGDLNGDLMTDVCTTVNSNPGRLVVRMGQGGLTFSLPLEVVGVAGPAVADFDLDGADEIVGTTATTVSVWKESAGAFSGPTVASPAHSSELGRLFSIDLDGDGDPDLVTRDATGEIVILWNELSIDCNQNGVPDADDIANGSSPDCDGNGIPDECDLAKNAEADCNANGILDSCDIAAGVELDCNGNGVPDSCDLAAGTSLDCDANGIPDECDIASGASDCNADGVPDACQITDDVTLDLNANGVLDSCEAIGTNYCSPAIANSTGAPAAILALGSEVVASNDLTMTVSGLPLNTFAMFVTSQTQGYAFPVPGSQGALCVTGFPGRFSRPGQIQSSGSSGSLVFPVDLTSLPTPIGFTAAQPGDTWNFQAWYRDANPTVTSNFTDAVGITFQ